MFEKIVQILNGLFPKLPTEAEARLHFPHKDDCQADRSMDQRILVEDADITMFDPRIADFSNLEKRTGSVSIGDQAWTGSITFDSYFLKCKHCGATLQYAEEVTE